MLFHECIFICTGQTYPKTGQTVVVHYTGEYFITYERYFKLFMYQERKERIAEKKISKLMLYDDIAFSL
jgi:hypothetical protein